MVSVGGGLALTGLRPIIHTYAPFLIERSFEQIKLDLTHQGVPAVLVSVGASYDWTEGGRTHQSPGDVALLAVGPILDPVLAATAGLDVTVAYTNTVRPLDLNGLRDLTAADTVVLVEPYLAGTSTRLIDEALSDRPHRTLALGVSRTEQRRYGTPEQHDVLHGLDAAGLRHSLSKFLTGTAR